MKLQGKTGRVIAQDVEISFQRSREGRSLGHAPFDRVRDYAATSPAEWPRTSAIFLHLLPGESLWIGISGEAPVTVAVDGVTLSARPSQRWIEGTASHPLRPPARLTIHLSPNERLVAYLIAPDLYEQITGCTRRQPTPDEDTYGGYLLP